MLSQTQKEKIVELYKLGVSFKRIAEEVGCCSRTVSDYVKKNGLKGKPDEMIGQRFGSLVVLRQAPKREGSTNRCKRYICQCDCGNIVDVNGSYLRLGETTSCGCARKRKNIIDLTGQQFGKLTALYVSGRSKRREAVWHCKCECGKECDAPADDLKSGNTKSCGCLKSYKEEMIQEWLDKNQINYVREYSFTDLRDKVKPLRFDFAILNQNNQLLCLIEYQGRQHTDLESKYYSEEMVEHDNRKKEYCQQHNIILYELDKTHDIEEELIKIIGELNDRLSANY